MPRIDQWRPWLEHKATAALGLPVSIGALEARRHGGLLPALVLRDVVVQEAGAARQPGLRQDTGLPGIAAAPGEALRIARIDLTLSVRRLLLHRGIERLVVEGPELTVRRTADGRILLLGHDLRQPREHQDNAGRDWLFGQPELSLHGGTLHWVDALRPSADETGAPLTLSALELQLRNRGGHHDLDGAATPPADWGDRLRASGRFVSGADAQGAGDWHAWDGRLQLSAPRIDLAPLRRHLAPAAVGGLDVARGRGALQLQADLRHGALASGAADIAVDDLDARLADGLERLALPRLRARLTGSHADDGSFSLTTQGLDFALGSSRMPRQWPGGNIDLHQTAAAPGATESGRLRADRIDLGMLASLGRSLPLDPAVRRQLQAHAPRGLVETLTAHWRGPVSSPSTYQVAGRATGLAVASVPLTGADAFMVTSTGRKRPRAGTPGIEGASLSFDFDQSQGTARLEIEQGALDFPGVFEEPRLPMHRLSAEARWRVAGRHIEVDVPALRFANADTQGRASLRWQTADAQEGRPDVEGEAHPGRFPGVLDLRGSLGETAGDRVWRYLPTAIPDSARHYVRDAVLAGRATGVEFRVNGDLHHMPFAHPGEGEFRIAAQLKDVTFDFAPQAVLRRAAAEHPERRGLRRDGTRAPAGAGDESPHPWPVLVGLSGALIFEGGTMEVRDARGALAARRLGADEASGDEDAEPLPVDRASARIPDLQHPVVQVRAAAHGDADRMLSIVRGSPLARMVGGSLDRASARGPATLDLALGLPIGRLHETTVQGRVALDRADLRITPDTPLLADTRGAIDFTATGFTATGIRTRMLGGESRVDGRMTGGGTALPLVGFTARGQITAEGVQAERELGFVSRLAARAAGGTDYEAGLTVRYGQPELRIVSSLRGLALDLPAPMGKAAGDKLPLYYRSALVDASLPSSAAVAAHAAQARQPHAGDSGGGTRYPGLRDRLQVQLGDIAAIDYERDLSGPQATVLRGTIGVGLDKGDVLPLPEDGVMAQVNFADVDLDAWERVLADATAGPVRVTAPRRAPPVSPGPGPEAASAGAPGLSASQTYLPDAIAVRADSLTLYGRTVHGVVVGGSREGATWRANLLARELNGYLEYRQPAGAGDAGRVFARLARLDLPQATAREVGSLLEKQPMAARSMPTLDIAIDDFAFNGIPIGQVALAGGPPGAQEASGTATAANAANASGTEVASLWNTGPDDRLLDEENFPQMAEAGAADDTVLPPPAPGDVLWRLRQLRVRMPEALLLAAGDWHQAGGDADGPRRQQASVQVRLDLQDGGRTLQRLGLGDRLLDGGTGRLQGRLAWDDGLLSPDRASLRGRLRVDARDGDLKTVPVGAAKWIGLVNLRSLPRRLRGDFRDLASEGFFFDTLRGDVAVDRGVARTDSLQMQGVIARVEAAGSTDLVRATQDLEVRIRPEADAGLLSILATAVDPAWGLGTLAAQLVLREPLSRMLGRRMRITGTWSAPKVETLARREQDDVPSPADPAGIVAAAAPLPSASGAHP